MCFGTNESLRGYRYSAGKGDVCDGGKAGCAGIVMDGENEDGDNNNNDERRSKGAPHIIEPSG